MAKSLKEMLARHPHVALVEGVSPLEPLPRLGEALGIDLRAKRDDVLPLAFGGNKVRQLEYYLGPAVAKGCDTVLITGAIQSNFVRLCAAAARKLGMRPVVQLEKRVPNADPEYANSGNVLLNRLFGAEIHFFDEGEDEAAADLQLEALADALRSQGARPYVIHLGTDHPPRGALGYCAAADETHTQCDASDWWPDHVVVPSGSGLTHSGFLCGARVLGWKVPVHGICVRRAADLQRARIVQRAGETMELLGAGAAIADSDIKVDDSVLSPGYGQLNPEVQEAMDLAARLEGLLVDPVYSARTLAGLILQVRSGEIGKNARVLFLHTGGQVALFGYKSALALKS